MSTPSTPGTTALPVSSTQLVWAVVVLVMGSVAAVCFLAFALPEGKNPALYVGLVFQTLLQVLGLIALMFKVGQVKNDVSAIRNGEMEGKLHHVLDQREEGATRAASLGTPPDDKR